MTKHISIEENNLERFDETLDKVSKENNVFATQTHVTALVTGQVFYNATCFIREPKEEK